MEETLINITLFFAILMFNAMLVNFICEIIDSHKFYKELREANRKHTEYLDKQIERLEGMEDDE